MVRILSNNHDRLLMELLKGRETATRLQTLLHKPAHEADADGLGSARRLALQIERSFTDTLSTLSSCAGPGQIAAVCAQKGPPRVKERRGCYKRRRTSDSWVKVSSAVDDGCAWRKYGQKAIMNSKYPRCYFRCTHKYEGCKATKQVQRIKEEPIAMYQTTYFNRHTCTQTLRPGLHLTPDDDTEPNLISFDSNVNIPPKQDHQVSQVKQESKEDHDDDQDLSSDEGKSSTLQDPWQDMGLESMGCRPDWASMMVPSYETCGSASLHGLDMEVNQLGDLDYSWYFD